MNRLAFVFRACSQKKKKKKEKPLETETFFLFVSLSRVRSYYIFFSIFVSLPNVFEMETRYAPLLSGHKMSAVFNLLSDRMIERREKSGNVVAP